MNRPTLLFILLLCSTACSGARIDSNARYNGATIPLSVDARFEQNRVAYEAGEDGNEQMGPVVLQYLRSWRLFDSLQSSTNPDLVAANSSNTELIITITGRLDRQSNANEAKRRAVAFTLFLAAPFLDMTADYSHTIDAKLINRGQLLGQYSVPVTTEIKRGYSTSAKDFTPAEYQLTLQAHATRLAAALAELIARDRQNILAAANSGS